MGSCTACTLYFCLPNRVGAGTTISTRTWGSPTHCRNLGAVKLFHLVLESQMRKLSQGSSESWRLSICHVSLSVSQLKLNWGLKRKHIYNFNNNCKDKIEAAHLFFTSSHSTWLKRSLKMFLLLKAILELRMSNFRSQELFLIIIRARI